MADQIEEIKSKIDIVSLIGEHVELKKAGRNYKALCPFHSEKTPSFMVSPELQIFKCFGCQKGGDAITFLQEYEGMDFYEALKFLAQKTGIKLKPLSPQQRGSKEVLYEINKLAQHFYSWILLNHPAGKVALDYVQKVRGLTLDTIKTFKLGFSPDHPLALRKFLIDKKRVNLKDLEHTGLIFIKGSDILDKFRGRIIFPLYDHRGNVVGFSGRILPKDDKKDLAKYINTPETEIYHKGNLLYGLNLTKGEIKKAKFSVVVEGELDLISSWQVGIKNVVAIKGSALTESQARLLSRFAENVVLALDTDLAGNEAARRGIEISERQGLEVKVVRLGGFKDPDEAAQKNPDALKKAISEAKGVWDFIIDSIFSRYSGATGIDTAKISKEVVPILSSINDRIVQAHFIDLVAKRLGVPVEAVNSQISSLKISEIGGREVEVETRVVVKPRRELLEERFLALIFRHDSKILLNSKLTKLITTPFAKRIVEEFRVFSKTKKEFDPSLFASELPRELVDGYIGLILKDIKGLDEETPERLARELKLVERELKIVDAKKRMDDLAEKIQNLEKLKEKEKIKESEEEFKELANLLHELESGNFRGIIL